MSRFHIHKLFSIPNFYVRVLSHFFFWVLAYLFLISIFLWNNNNPQITIILTSFLIPVSASVAYFFNYYLIPKYLSQKRYLRFFYFSFYTILVSLWLSFLTAGGVLMYIINNFNLKLDLVYIHPELQIIIMYFIIFLAIAIKQAKQVFFIQQEKNQLEKIKLTTELKLKEAELKLLKAQIQPHFLFNTLNNLYGLTLEKSDEAPRLVLSLSNILDYILYHCNEKFVSLEKEIDNLLNYIEIEKIRYTSKLVIEHHFPDDTKEIKIAPLILIPFIENAFKHGVSNNPGDSYIKIDITLQEDNINFQVCNSKSPLKHSGGSGIGLKNVKKRLELIYPGNHELEVKNNPTEFCVHLKLKTGIHV